MNRVDGSEKERKATKEQSGKVRKPGRNGGEGKGEAGEGESFRGGERHVETPTILINPVPGAQSRSRRSNRVHDLQGIYIRSSTRGYNSIPSLYSALEEPFNQGGPMWAPDTRCTHNPRSDFAVLGLVVIVVVVVVVSLTRSPQPLLRFPYLAEDRR